ncbi:MAG: hypothetical protein LCH73_02870 [Proteobacteria bacterium]|nr:hypothetical protein [Pseudomonadota bacterium]
MTDPADRRRSLLATLYFAPASTATALALARDMERVHSIATSRDQVRGDLAWLQEQGLVALHDDVAQLTERGRDVARGAAAWSW